MQFEFSAKHRKLIWQLSNILLKAFFKSVRHPFFVRVTQTYKRESVLYVKKTHIAWTMIWNEYETLQSNLSL